MKHFQFVFVPNEEFKTQEDFEEAYMVKAESIVSQMNQEDQATIASAMGLLWENSDHEGFNQQLLILALMQELEDGSN